MRQDSSETGEGSDRSNRGSHTSGCSVSGRRNIADVDRGSAGKKAGMDSGSENYRCIKRNCSAMRAADGREWYFSRRSLSCAGGRDDSLVEDFPGGAVE